MPLEADRQFAVSLARGAGKIALEHYGKVARLTKRFDEAVTDADRACQRFIIKALREKYPGEGLVGEENETGHAITFECPDPRGRVWVIDPIDGTNNFIAGFGNFAVCIGLLDAGHPAMGVVYDVTRDLMYSAARGGGAWRAAGGNDRGEAIRVAQGPPDASWIMMSSSSLIDAHGKAPSWRLGWLGRRPGKMRILGSAALDVMQVAAGVAHGSITTNGKLWDIVAPAAIVLEAGGMVTDPLGKAVFPFTLEKYAGAKVPFITAAPTAHELLLREFRSN